MNATHKAATSGRGLLAGQRIIRDHWSRLIFFVTLITILPLRTFAGCNTNSGPQRFHLSGEVTFDGQPIPAGMVVFTPDGAKGNSGPQGTAAITAGKYDTRAEDGLGIGGGPTVIRVTGLGGAGGTKLLCEYEYRVDLPKEDSTHKIEVPASAANTKPATPEI